MKLFCLSVFSSKLSLLWFSFNNKSFFPGIALNQIEKICGISHSRWLLQRVSKALFQCLAILSVKSISLENSLCLETKDVALKQSDLN